jgi:hypothetical protein
MAARSQELTVFTLSNTGIVGSNPIRGMEVGVCVVLPCDGLVTRPRRPIVYVKNIT